MIGSKHEWGNLNELRPYPLEYASTPVADTGFALPCSLLADCFVVLQSDSAEPYLYAVHFSGATVSASFVDRITEKEIFVAQASLLGGPSRSRVLDVGGFGASGTVLFGDVRPLFQMAYSGAHSFASSAPKLSERCFLCAGPPPILSLSANIGAISGEATLRLSGGLSCSATTSDPATTDGTPEHNLVIYLSSPEDFLPSCSPAADICGCKFTPVSKINTVSPDENGNITLSVSDEVAQIISVSSAGNAIILSLVAVSESACPPENIPLPDGRLPSEKDETA